MRRLVLSTLSLFLTAFVARSPVSAQTPVLPANSLLVAGLQRPDTASATRTVFNLPDQAFSQAVRIQTAKVPANPWQIQLGLPTIGAVATGDTLAGEIWLRRVAPAGGNATAELVFEQAGPPYRQSLTRVLGEDSGNWTRFRFAFTTLAAYPAGGAQFNVRLGYGIQTLELGGLVLTNYAQTRALASFPNDFTYAGRSATAGWRTNAAANIEKHRKAPLSVEVRDAAGFSVPGVQVEFHQTRSAFAFGSAVVAARLLGTGSDDRTYQGIVTNWFNTVVLENDLKWPQYEPNPLPAQRAVDWLRARQIAVRGHTIIWPGTNQPAFLPADVRGLLSDPARLKKRIDGRFTNVLTRFQGKLADWDVVNEPLHETAVEGVLGRDELVHWFQLAHDLDPAATRYLNEYENLESVTRDGTLRLRALAEDLRSRGAPLEALGLQGHFGSYLTPPTEVLARLDLLGGIEPPANAWPLRLTEFDINTADEAVQADYTRDLLTAAFSHPSVNGVLLWGFWANQHWLPQAALFRPNWEPKPAALVWSNLTTRTWLTRTNVRTSVSGLASIRGFKGDYRLRVHWLDRTNELPATVLSDAALKVTLPVVPPDLSVKPGDTLEFRWPAYATGYALESTDDLTNPNWQSEELIPIYSVTGWRLQLAPAPNTRFYRLHRPGTPP